MQKKIIRAASIFLLMICMLTAYYPLTATAATNPSIVFDCVYSRSNDQLIVTAYITNPDTVISTGMFVLEYDTNILSTSENKITFLSGSNKSAKYFNTEDGYVGADWYYDTPLKASYNKQPTIEIIFDVKTSGSLSSIKNALSVCNAADYLNKIGSYGSDGGVLLCTDSSNTYSMNSGTATADFSYSTTTKQAISFNGIYSADGKTLTVTASVVNPDTKVGAAMFVLGYDTSILSISDEEITYLGNANKSMTYMSNNGTSTNYIGADWYYDTALPASNSKTAAIQMVFDVKNNASFDDVKKALTLCDDYNYLSSIGYGTDGGVLLCENGTTFYNVISNTVEAVFTYEKKELDSTSTTESSTTSDNSSSSLSSTTHKETASTSSTNTSNGKDDGKDVNTGDDSFGLTMAWSLLILCFFIIFGIIHKKRHRIMEFINKREKLHN